jgi:hypothetical protein
VRANAPRRSAALARRTASVANATADPRPFATEAGVTDIGTRIDETGTLVRDGGAFYLRRDAGGRYQLELQRTPVDLVEKRVRLIGTLVGDDLVNADGVAPV